LTVVHVVVEGETEEAFINQVLAPHFWLRGLNLSPHIVATRRGLHETSRGGVTQYHKLKKEIHLYLPLANTRSVTTMIDFYQLPKEFPGRDSIARQGSCYERVLHLETAFSQDINHASFIPYLSLHEFEALVLAADPADLVSAFPDSKLKEFAAALPEFGPPEEIDEGADTHPAARLLGAVPGYRKRIDGPRITERVGLARLRSRCPHFDEWVSRLEALAE
jgi:Domain of unknown function (DUF4276)